jgi:hypothetical protein
MTSTDDGRQGRLNPTLTVTCTVWEPSYRRIEYRTDVVMFKDISGVSFKIKSNRVSCVPFLRAWALVPPVCQAERRVFSEAPGDTVSECRSPLRYRPNMPHRDTRHVTRRCTLCLRSRIASTCTLLNVELGNPSCFGLALQLT